MEDMREEVFSSSLLEPEIGIIEDEPIQLEELDSSHELQIDGQQPVDHYKFGCFSLSENTSKDSSDVDITVHQNFKDNANNKPSTPDSASVSTGFNQEIETIFVKQEECSETLSTCSFESIDIEKRESLECQEENENNREDLSCPVVESQLVTTSDVIDSEDGKTRNEIASPSSENEDVNHKNELMDKENVCSTCRLNECVSCEHQVQVTTLAYDKPFQCTVCEYRCKFPSLLKVHMRKHTQEKPFLCTVCDFKCAQISALKRHMKTHTGEKPHPCTVCDFRAADLFNLNRHIKTHTGEKPYACPLCDYRCPSSSNLKSHLKTHTGEKPFICSICDYKSTFSSALKSHMKTHTGEKPFSCTMCGYRCARSAHLKVHMKTQHL